MENGEVFPFSHTTSAPQDVLHIEVLWKAFGNQAGQYYGTGKLLQ
jgi:hypothetical protein